MNSTDTSPDLALATVVAALDEALAFLNEGEVAAALGTANDAIALATRELDDVDMGLISRRAHDHAFGKAVMADPLTRHSFARPRGYPGDAGLLDCAC